MLVGEGRDEVAVESFFLVHLGGCDDQFLLFDEVRGTFRVGVVLHLEPHWGREFHEVVKIDRNARESAVTRGSLQDRMRLPDRFRESCTGDVVQWVFEQTGMFLVESQGQDESSSGDGGWADDDIRRVEPVDRGRLNC